MPPRSNQVKREQLTDADWAAMCRLFEVVERIGRTLGKNKDKREGGPQ